MNAWSYIFHRRLNGRDTKAGNVAKTTGKTAHSSAKNSTGAFRQNANHTRVVLTSQAEALLTCLSCFITQKLRDQARKLSHLRAHLQHADSHRAEEHQRMLDTLLTEMNRLAAVSGVVVTSVTSGVARVVNVCVVVAQGGNASAQGDADGGTGRRS